MVRMHGVGLLLMMLVTPDCSVFVRDLIKIGSCAVFIQSRANLFCILMAEWPDVKAVLRSSW